MYEKLRRIDPALVNRKGSILLQDNARPYYSLKTLQKLNELHIEVLPHDTYSPDFSATDLHFFKFLDHFLSEKCFATQGEVENGIKEFIDSMEPALYTLGIENLAKRWQSCIDSTGFYFD
ncbi:unnamed protein product, partial [Mesorhabditis belari]|uniref:Histone-lysine N-methyltransferase SETMAR n=1 Tax=Mesorhabditis belari TaxID=2138241 RepID=A0AAF3FKS7_9BILA